MREFARRPVLAMLFVLTLLVAVGCEKSADSAQSADGQAAAAAPAPGDEVSGAQARKLVEQGATLLDVRTPGEFESGHIDGAVNLPIQQFGQRQAELAKLEQPIVVYCQSGGRSASALDALRDMGVKDVYDLGGIGSW